MILKPRTIRGTKTKISKQLTLSIRQDGVLVILIGEELQVTATPEEARGIYDYLLLHISTIEKAGTQHDQRF